MKEIEVSGKTVDEAIQTALEQLGVSEDKVEVTVLKKGRPGVLGMGVEEAKIRARLKAENAEKGNAVEVAKDVLEEQTGRAHV
jgi:spoIIIJ-associated protein